MEAMGTFLATAYVAAAALVEPGEPCIPAVCIVRTNQVRKVPMAARLCGWVRVVNSAVEVRVCSVRRTYSRILRTGHIAGLLTVVSTIGGVEWPGRACFNPNVGIRVIESAVSMKYSCLVSSSEISATLLMDASATSASVRRASRGKSSCSGGPQVASESSNSATSHVGRGCVCAGGLAWNTARKKRATNGCAPNPGDVSGDVIVDTAERCTPMDA